MTEPNHVETNGAPPRPGGAADGKAPAGGSGRVIVSVDHVARVFRVGDEEVRALDGVTLDIMAGEYLSIMGPSGSGKSTLFNMIGGLDTPTTGTVSVLGVRIAQLSRIEQARLRNRAIGYIFQSYNLIPVMTALQNVSLPMLLGGMDLAAAHDKAKLLLQAVELGERLHNRPDQLSGGQQQRVAIARAFANDPVIILADEPTGNLDTVTGEKIINVLSNLSRERGVTIISATHDHKMLSVSDRVVTIRGGKIDKIERRDELKITVGSISTGDPEHDAQSKARQTMIRLPPSQDGVHGRGGAIKQGQTLVEELRKGWAALPNKTLLALAMGGLRVRMMRSAVTMLSVVLAIAFLTYTGLTSRLERNLADQVTTFENKLQHPPDSASVSVAVAETATPALIAPLSESDKRSLALTLGMGNVDDAQLELVGLPDKLRQARRQLETAKKTLNGAKKKEAPREEIKKYQAGVARLNLALRTLKDRQDQINVQVAFAYWLRGETMPDTSQAGESYDTQASPDTQASSDAQMPETAPSGAAQDSEPAKTEAPSEKSTTPQTAPDPAAQFDGKLNEKIHTLLNGLHSADRLTPDDCNGIKRLLDLAKSNVSAGSITVLQRALDDAQTTHNDDDLRGMLRHAGVDLQKTLAGDPLDTWLIVMAMLTCAVGIANAMLMSVTERIREIGTMKCLGAQDNLVVKLFLLESAFLGVVGAVLGIALGIVVALLGGLMEFGGYGSTDFPVVQAVPVLVWSMFGGVLLSVVGASFPAFTASRKRPVDALRVEE